jgi:helicase
MPKINTKFKANKDNIKEVLSKHDVYVSFVQNNEATAASLIEWINEHKEYEIENYLKVYAASTRRASYEASNLVKYFYDICEVLGNYRYLNEIDKLSSRLYYGVKEDLIPLVIGIKRLGRQRARSLVDVFGSNLSNASAQELMKIDGIGETTANNIIEFYNKKYQ